MRATQCLEHGPIDELVLGDVPAPEIRPGAVIVDVLPVGTRGLVASAIGGVAARRAAGELVVVP